ncbi:MAG: DUF4843 domain-containing protein [Odoribacteraceae bacterium]|jgi:hypothetical protein|nr:DUF4843 domain-containing protein [Odoribacteraceae bacterium]
MKKEIITLLAAALLGLSSCQEAGIPLYSGENYIQVVKNLTVDSTTVAFLLAPGATELDSFLIVKTTGSGYPGETPYEISIDRQLTTAVEGTHFKLPTTTAFKPGAMRDTLPVTFYRTPDMKTRSFRLVLRVEENEAFKPGQLQYRHKVFVMHDKIARPDWWTAATTYLGVYSDLKYQTLIDATGVADLTGASPSEMRVRALQLKYWLEEYKATHDGRPLTEENGDEVTVPING